MFKNTRSPPEESLILKQFLNQNPNQLQKTLQSVYSLASSAFHYIKKPLKYVFRSDFFKNYTVKPSTNSCLTEKKKSHKQKKLEKKQEKKIGNKIGNKILKYQSDSFENSIEIEETFSKIKCHKQNSKIELKYSESSIEELKKKIIKPSNQRAFIKRNFDLPRKRMKPNVQVEEQNNQLSQLPNKNLLYRGQSDKINDNIKFSLESFSMFIVEKANAILENQKKNQMIRQQALKNRNFTFTFGKKDNIDNSTSKVFATPNENIFYNFQSRSFNERSNENKMEAEGKIGSMGKKLNQNQIHFISSHSSIQLNQSISLNKKSDDSLNNSFLSREFRKMKENH